jgi:xanthine dehydrogenase accessory factor
VAARRLIVVGDDEVAENLMRLADMLGYDSVMSAGEDLPGDLGKADDVVVTLREPRKVQAILRTASEHECRYIGLVAPERQAVQALIALSHEESARTSLDRVTAPAGIDIGARTPGEWAVAVAAELVATRRSGEVGPGLYSGGRLQQ